MGISLNVKSILGGDSLGRYYRVGHGPWPMDQGGGVNQPKLGIGDRGLAGFPPYPDAPSALGPRLSIPVSGGRWVVSPVWHSVRATGGFRFRGAVLEAPADGPRLYPQYFHNHISRTSHLGLVCASGFFIFSSFHSLVTFHFEIYRPSLSPLGIPTLDQISHGLQD